MIQPGHLIAERFLVKAFADQGGMGSIFRAIDQESGQEVAIKVLLGKNPHEARFWREAKVLAALNHPGIVRYIDHGKTRDGHPYLAMEWLEGEDLAGRLRREGVTVEESVALGVRVAETLSVAHARGIVHRDLKPSNLFLPGRKPSEVKILDFGVAHLGGASQAMTRAGALLGTPGYMAPEQARGEQEIDARADLFALGCVLFECLTGKPAFPGESMLAILAKILLEDSPRLREVRGDLPSALDELIARLLCKSPSGRPQDAGEVARLLRGLSGLPQVSLAPPSAPRRRLTESEQRLLCVVLVRSLKAALALAEGATQPVALPDDSLAHTLPAFSEKGQSAFLRLTEVAERYGGRLEPLADGSFVVVVSGAGVATDLAIRAARLALALARRLPGAAVALATGRGELEARGPVGEAIDRAAQRLLQPSTSKPGVLLDEVSAGLLDGRFVIEGDAHGLILVRESEAREALHTVHGRPSPLVGRERDLLYLESLLVESIEEEAARAVLVVGPAGAGKSRLRYELMKRVLRRPEKVEILWGRGDPMRAGAPFGLLSSALRRACRIRDGEPLSLQQRKLRARLSRHLPPGDLVRVAEFLGEMIGVRWPKEEASIPLLSARKDPQLMADQFDRALRDWLWAESSAAPLLLILEDLHWGDSPTVRFVEAAYKHLQDKSLLVLAFARPEVEDLFPRLFTEAQGIKLPLRALSRKMSQKLVRALLGEETPLPVIHQIAEKAGGNPFYLEELCRAARLGKGEALPETVLAMLQARLEQLPGEARRVLRAASIFGQTFWEGGVRHLLGEAISPTALSEWLGHLEEQEICLRRSEERFPEEREYRFRQTLFQEAAYAMLTEKDRALGHRLAGEWLLTKGARDPLMLAEHMEKGGERGKAAYWYRRAGEQALEASDLAKALEWTERARLCGAKGEELGSLLALEAEVHFWRSEPEPGEKKAKEALSLLPQGSELWCRALRGLLVSGVQQGKDPEALHPLVAMLKEAHPAPEAQDAYVVALTPIVAFLRVAGLYPLADALLSRAEEIAARGIYAPRTRAWLTLAKGARALLTEGDPAARLHWTQRARDMFAQAGDQRGVGLCLVQIGGAERSLGLLARSLRSLKEALSLAESLGVRHTAWVARNSLSLSLAQRGELAEAESLQKEAIEVFCASKNRVMEGLARSYHAYTLISAQRPEEAASEARLACSLLEKAPPYRAYAFSLLADALRAQGDAKGALSAASQGAQLLDALGGRGYDDLAIRLAHAQALRFAGEQRSACAVLVKARERLLSLADGLKEPSMRESFLEAVPENAQILALARDL